MKKAVSLLMALVLVISLIPMTASADSKAKKPVKPTNGTHITAPNKNDKDHHKPEVNNHHKKNHKKKAPINLHDDANHTSCGYGYNTEYHWIQYACGCKFNVEPHVDPKSTTDDICTCGYQFSDNADLVTLWVDGCPPIKKFNKNTTEYELDAYTYKDVTEIQISTNTFDSEATVELPKDLTLKEGENKFEVKVVAENQKNSKIYTLIINKETKK